MFRGGHHGGSQPHFTPRGRGRGRGYGSSTSSFGSSGRSSEFCCDPCDRSFRSQSDLDAHMAEHQKCPWAGCHLVAHPKILEKHISMQHLTGLAERIPTLNTPEEIAKWREDRKKNFPTKDNVTRKETEKAQKQARGVLEAPTMRFAKPRMPFLSKRGRGRGGYERGRGHGNGYGEGRGRGRGDHMGWRGRGQFRGRGGRGRRRDVEWGSNDSLAGSGKPEELNNCFFGDYDGPDEEEMGVDLGEPDVEMGTGICFPVAKPCEVQASEVEQLANVFKGVSTGNEEVANFDRQRMTARQPFRENVFARKRREEEEAKREVDEDEEQRDVPMFGGSKVLAKRRRDMKRRLYNIFGDFITEDERAAKKERKARRIVKRELRQQKKQKEREAISDSDGEAEMEVDRSEEVVENSCPTGSDASGATTEAAALNALLGAYGSSSDEEGEIKSDSEPQPEAERKEEPKSEPEEGEITDDDDTCEATVVPTVQATGEEAMDVSAPEEHGEDGKKTPTSGEKKKRRRQKKRKRVPEEKEKEEKAAGVDAETTVETKPPQNADKPFRPKRGQGQKDQQLPRKFMVPLIRKSLLEKLLANDILRERSLIFQSVKYVVANNFFDEEQPPEETSMNPSVSESQVPVEETTPVDS